MKTGKQTYTSELLESSLEGFSERLDSIRAGESTVEQHFRRMLEYLEECGCGCDKCDRENAAQRVFDFSFLGDEEVDPVKELSSLPDSVEEDINRVFEAAGKDEMTIEALVNEMKKSKHFKDWLGNDIIPAVTMFKSEQDNDVEGDGE